MSCFSFPKIICAVGLIGCAAMQQALAASATSDALYILDADGRGYTVQHTIGSDGPTVALDIPSDAQSLQQHFLGPNNDQHANHESRIDGLVALSNGVALVRYRHQYEDELTQTGPATYQLSLPSLPQNFSVEDGDINRSSFTWIFPKNIELLSYSAIAEDMGLWQQNSNELVYEQTERFAVTLSIEYQVHDASAVSNDATNAASETFCFPTADDRDLCAADSDGDAVPDYRDVCWDNSAATTVALDPTSHRENKDANSPNISLNSEQSKHFEIGAHTDDRGNADTNLVLARKRADTVRYYLLLRGVNPNQIRAKGYGEQFPLFDNSTAEGQRNNRRIEITLIAGLGKALHLRIVIRQ